MKTKRWMRYLAMAMALALAMATPLQASEYVTEDTTEAVPVVASDDAAAGEELSSEEDIIVEETDLAEAVSAESTASAAEISEEDTTLEVTDIAEIDSFDSKGTTIGTTTSATFRKGVLLHVVHGNFSGEYNEEDISGKASVWVQAQCLNQLPCDVKNINVTRSNGEFVGWYTKAPTEVLETKGDGSYSVWHTVKKNGTKIEPGQEIPEGVHILYAVFDDAKEVKESDKLITFYLDWNGIDGQQARLTCTRGYKNDEEPKFTAEDAAVFGLNYGIGCDDKKENESKYKCSTNSESGGEYCLDGKNSEQKWKILKRLWGETTFNGYKFLGWAKTPDATGTDDLIWEDTTIKNGDCFYAVWEKDGKSNKDFERVDPEETGPLEGVRIMAGDGTTFTSGTLSASKHGIADASFTLNLFCTPVGVKLKDVTWTLKITEGLNDGDHLADLFQKEKEAVTVSVVADSKDRPKELPDWLEVEATGSKLTVTNKSEKTCCSIVVSAKATGTNGGSEKTPASATLCFNHSWDVDYKESPSCKKGGKIYYTCTECKAEEIKTTAPLGHFYKTGIENEPGQEYYEVVKLPTCTTAGTKQYICQRCGETCGGTASIPATGHCWGEWKVTKEPTVSETGVKTRSCEHCEEQETEILPRLVAASQDGQPDNDEADEDDPAGNSVPTPEVKPEDNTQNGTTENEAKTGDPVQDDEQTGKDTVNSAPTISAPTVSAPTSYAVNSVAKTVSAGKNAAKTGWQKVGKKKYYYVNGVKQTGWKKIGKKKYYFGKNGVMQTGWKTIGKKKYYFGKNGVMRTGKQKIGKKIYVFGKNGALKK